jgi:hypothetical protein
MKKYLLYLALMGLSACNSYQILKEFKMPIVEKTRLETLVKKEKLEQVDPNEVLKEHDFSIYQAPFFVFLYNLERNKSQYIVNNQDLVSFFDERDLDTLWPVDALEKMVKEKKILRLYNSSFKKDVPGTFSQVALRASDNLQFRVKKYKSHIELHLAEGSLEVVGTVLAEAAGFKDFKCNYIRMHPVKDDFQVVFARKKGASMMGVKYYLVSQEISKMN